MEKVLYYSTDEAIAAQAAYCDMKNVPMFAPGYGSHGCCYNCHNPIYIKGGISVEEASTRLITGCPYCHASYVD